MSAKKNKRASQKKYNKALLTILIIIGAIVLLVACVSFAREMTTSDEGYWHDLLNEIQALEQPESSAPTNQAVTSAMEIPLCPATLTGENGSDHEVHTYNGFTLCYRETYEDAEWVAYQLTKEELKGVIGRTDDFRPDPKITTKSASLADYKGSGYDRGHLAPAADLEWSEESCRDSFLMSNMTPQAPQFNRGLWKTLEEQVRDWADEFGSIYVVTGPVLEKSADKYPFIGTNHVAVPEYFYKVILARADDGNSSTTIGIGFILPNTKCDGTIWDYAVSIDEVEKRTGLDFFTMLEDGDEGRIEASLDTKPWK